MDAKQARAIVLVGTTTAATATVRVGWRDGVLPWKPPRKWWGGPPHVDSFSCTVSLVLPPLRLLLLLLPLPLLLVVALRLLARLLQLLLLLSVVLLLCVLFLLSAALVFFFLDELVQELVEDVHCRAQALQPPHHSLLALPQRGVCVRPCPYPRQVSGVVEGGQRRAHGHRDAREEHVVQAGDVGRRQACWWR